MLKYWDGDKFEQILSLPGHQAEVWGLAVSAIGDFVVTGAFFVVVWCGFAI